MNKVIKEYDNNGNMIYFKNSYGFERWSEYDKNNNLIHFKTNDGEEEWYKYDENNERIYNLKEEFIVWVKREPDPIFTKFTRFDIMDI